MGRGSKQIMTTKLIFDIIGSEINHIARHNSFNQWIDGELDYENDDAPNSYLNYEKHAAQPAIDWCYENDITDFIIDNAEYAMKIAFIFNDIEDAMAFKLRWWNKRCDFS